RPGGISPLRGCLQTRLPERQNTSPPGANCMTRTVFFVSDSTGITAETLGHSILTQFKSLECKHVTLPFVVSDETTHSTVAKINATAQKDGHKPIVFSTLVDEAHREILHRCDGLVMDLFG